MSVQLHNCYIKKYAKLTYKAKAKNVTSANLLFSANTRVRVRACKHAGMSACENTELG